MDKDPLVAVGERRNMQVVSKGRPRFEGNKLGTLGVHDNHIFENGFCLVRIGFSVQRFLNKPSNLYLSLSFCLVYCSREQKIKLSLKVHRNTAVVYTAN